MDGNSSTFKVRAFSGILWKFLEKISTQSISIVVQIILARLLMPEDYGMIGYLLVFINISDVFLTQGITTALIQKKNADQLDFSSVFYVNIAMSVILYTLFFFLAPYIALFYNEPRLTELMRVLSLNVVIGSFSAVHNAVLTKHLEFKKVFVRGLVNTVMYGLSGIGFACLGYGVWALVYARLIGTFAGTIALWLTVKWKPQLMFSIQRVRSLFGFSSKVLGSNLLNTLFNNINPLIIGKFYNSAALGQYQRGQNIPQAVMSAIDGSMTEVMYPAFSEIQNDITRVKAALRRSMKLSLYFVLPMLTGLLVVAKPLTLVLLTEKWLPSVPYMQLTCVICMFWPLSARTHALNSLGKSGITFKLSLISKALSLVCVLILAKVSVMAIMLGNIFVSLVGLLYTSFFIDKYIHYSSKELIRDIAPPFLLSAAMGVLVYAVQFLGLGALGTLVIQVPLGAAVYLAGSWAFKFESLQYLLQILKGLKKH